MCCTSVWNKYEDWWPMSAMQGNEISLPHSTGDPTLQSWSSSGWDPPSAKERLSWERNQTHSAWTFSRPREPPAVCNPAAIPDEFRGFSSFFCWQSSAGSWTSATQPCLTPEISALNWVLLPHTDKYSCLKGNLATAESTESLQMLRFSDELDLGFSAQQIQSHFLKVLIAAPCIYKYQMQMNAKSFPSSLMVHWPIIIIFRYIIYTLLLYVLYTLYI